MSKKQNIDFEQILKNVGFNILFAFLTMLVVINFYQDILLETVLLVIIAIFGLMKWKSKITLAIFAVGGIIGTFSEIIAVNYGVWNYMISNFINVPVWLFILWGNASAFIYQTALEIKKLGIKK